MILHLITAHSEWSIEDLKKRALVRIWPEAKLSRDASMLVGSYQDREHYLFSSGTTIVSTSTELVRRLVATEMVQPPTFNWTLYEPKKISELLTKGPLHPSYPIRAAVLRDKRSTEFMGFELGEPRCTALAKVLPPLLKGSSFPNFALLTLGFADNSGKGLRLLTVDWDGVIQAEVTKKVLIPDLVNEYLAINKAHEFAVTPFSGPVLKEAGFGDSVLSLHLATMWAEQATAVKSGQRAPSR